MQEMDFFGQCGSKSCFLIKCKETSLVCRHSPPYLIGVNPTFYNIALVATLVATHLPPLPLSRSAWPKKATESSKPSSSSLPRSPARRWSSWNLGRAHAPRREKQSPAMASMIQRLKCRFSGRFWASENQMLYKN